ncbi:MAG: hypothetical protein AAGD25_29025 [Cyanobacteria bacterium P01_F01_bin.150]
MTDKSPETLDFTFIALAISIARRDSFVSQSEVTLFLNSPQGYSS